MEDAGEREQRALARLLRFYRPGAGRWFGRWWPPRGVVWQLPLAMEAVATAYARTADPAHRKALSRWWELHRNRRSRFYDDDGWYVNAWLRAYEVTGEPRYLDTAEDGFAELTTGWDDTCGGGLWWSRDRSYKNAITNGLFLLAAARLGRLARTDEDRGPYREWALRAWTWFDGTGLINVDGLVNDGLADCRNNGQTTWTYNQGVLVSALVELFRLTGSRSYLDRAHTIAAAASSRLSDGGVLREPSEPDSDRDQEIFKGVLAQGLARLCRADPDRSAALREFLVTNADAVWREARDSRDRVGLAWGGPPTTFTAASHASAALLLGEVALIGA